MRHTVLFLVLLLSLTLTACFESKTPIAPPAGDLLVTGEANRIAFSRTDLEELPQSQVVYGGVSYIGIPMSRLIKAALYDPDAVKSVKVLTGDGATALFDAEMIKRKDFLVAFATTDGNLPAEEGIFILVWPDAAGRPPVRKLVEVQVSE